MKGKLIVLEGVDGSGKSTQFKMLTDALKKAGRSFRTVTFPRYSESSSALLRSYLNGEFGSDPRDVNAYAASTFFFVDRFASYKTDWGEFYNSGGVVLCDRYTTSNAIHQGAKLPEGEREGFFDWLYNFEFETMELPRPDCVLYMDIDIDTCLSQLKNRQQSGGAAADIHESHAGYLADCLKAGAAAADRLGWHRVRCLEKGKMRSMEDIHEEILKYVEEIMS